jgi:eukaryotic-like serine/threonine-protein kinase
VDLISPGRVLGNRYQLVEPVARGGMATVWIADDPVLSRRVAVKVLRADLAADDATRVRFRNEAIAAARLNHPNIVSTFDTGDDDGTAYIVMELVEGTNLRQVIDDHGGLPVRDVLRIGRQVADALDAAHQAGLVHRDVKPANVLVPAHPDGDGTGRRDAARSTAADAPRADGIPQGPVKVTDFGIAKATGGSDELTRTGMVMGTARYLAPEQVNGRTADARTDVYALGLLLYEMCCAHPPFGGDTDIATAMARLTTTPPSIRAERRDVPRALDDLVHRCLARDPAKRFASAAAVGHALDIVAGRAGSTRAAAGSSPKAAPQLSPVAATRPAAAPAAARPATPTRRRRRGSWLWLAVVFVVAAAAGVGAYLVVRDRTGDDGGGGAAAASSATPADEVGFTVTDFDPFDSDVPPRENPEQVDAVRDDDPESAWGTERYLDFSEKPGVGLRLDLDADAAVSSVTVSTRQSGWSGEIHLSEEDGASLTDFSSWGAAVASGTDVGVSHRFAIDPSRTARTVLVWFTALPTGPDGRQWLEVTGIQLG